jgi:hypothetical protein
MDAIAHGIIREKRKQSGALLNLGMNPKRTLTLALSPEEREQDL